MLKGWGLAKNRGSNWVLSFVPSDPSLPDGQIARVESTEIGPSDGMSDSASKCNQFYFSHSRKRMRQLLIFTMASMSVLVVTHMLYMKRNAILAQFTLVYIAFCPQSQLIELVAVCASVATEHPGVALELIRRADDNVLAELITELSTAQCQDARISQSILKKAGYRARKIGTESSNGEYHDKFNELVVINPEIFTEIIIRRYCQNPDDREDCLSFFQVYFPHSVSSNASGLYFEFLENAEFVDPVFYKENEMYWRGLKCASEKFRDELLRDRGAN